MSCFLTPGPSLVTSPGVRTRFFQLWTIVHPAVRPQDGASCPSTAALFSALKTPILAEVHYEATSILPGCRDYAVVSTPYSPVPFLGSKPKFYQKNVVAETAADSITVNFAAREGLCGYEPQSLRFAIDPSKVDPMSMAVGIILDPSTQPGAYAATCAMGRTPNIFFCDDVKVSRAVSKVQVSIDWRE